MELEVNEQSGAATRNGLNIIDIKFISIVWIKNSLIEILRGKNNEPKLQHNQETQKG